MYFRLESHKSAQSVVTYHHPCIQSYPFNLKKMNTNYLLLHPDSDTKTEKRRERPAGSSAACSVKVSNANTQIHTSNDTCSVSRVVGLSARSTNCLFYVVAYI